MSELVLSCGYWSALVARPGVSRIRDCTGLGVALYLPTGELLGTRFDTTDRAIRRGDLGEWARDMEFGAPEDVEAMRKKLDGMGNAMSVIQWDGLMPVLGSACTVETLDDLFVSMCDDPGVV